MVYAWNGFVLLAHNKACLGNMLTYTWLELAKVEDGKGSCLGEGGGRREGEVIHLVFAYCFIQSTILITVTTGVL